jgi:DNA-binding response OmpR family regulator
VYNILKKENKTTMNHHSLLEKLHPLHLLYVEDDIEVRSQIYEFLKRYFTSVQETSSAEEAMIQFKRKKPDIMLVDINLPGENGLSFAEAIRKEHHDVRIIISTAYTDKEFLLTAIELELTRYLIKPLTGQTLLEALEKASDEYALIYNREQLVDLGMEFTYNKRQRILRKNKQELSLRPKEMQLLEYFIAHSSEIIAYDILEYNIWQETTMSRDAIRSQIRNLRKKTHNKIIENISGIGYRLYQKEEL